MTHPRIHSVESRKEARQADFRALPLIITRTLHPSVIRVIVTFTVLSHVVGSGGREIAAIY